MGFARPLVQFSLLLIAVHPDSCGDYVMTSVTGQEQTTSDSMAWSRAFSLGIQTSQVSCNSGALEVFALLRGDSWSFRES